MTGCEPEIKTNGAGTGQGKARRRHTITDRQLRFVELVASGKPVGEAYRQAGYSSERWASAGGSRTLRIPAVRAKLEELRAGNAARSAISRDRIIEWLAHAVLTPAGSLTESDPVCQEVSRHYRGDELHRVTTRMVNKLAALKVLVGMMGWSAPPPQDGFDPASAWAEILRTLEPSSTPPASGFPEPEEESKQVPPPTPPPPAPEFPPPPRPPATPPAIDTEPIYYRHGRPVFAAPRAIGPGGPPGNAPRPPPDG